MLVKGIGDLHGSQKRGLEEASLQDTGNSHYRAGSLS